MKRSITCDARQIFKATVDSVLPQQIITRSLLMDGNNLFVNGCNYTLNHNVHMVGFGKAVIGMAAAVEEITGQHLVKAVLSVPVGIQQSFSSSAQINHLLKSDSKIKVLEGAVDNLPDEAAVDAAKEIASVAESVGRDDILIVLVSGGGSALLPAPLTPVTLEEKLQATNILAMNGATIQELNTIRKKLSQLKGGALAQLAKPAQVICLILSDVIGDPLDLIASGPTVQDTSTPSDALAIISKYSGESLMPKSVMKTLKEAAMKNPEDSDIKHRMKEDFSHVQNVLVGSNQIALQRGCEKAEQLGYHPLIMSSGIYGEARRLAEVYCNLSTLIGLLIRNTEFTSAEIKLKLLNAVKLMSEFGVCETFGKQLLEYIDISSNKPLCLIAGGETTVTLRGNGKGGRNQELALAAGVQWQKESLVADGMETEGVEVVLLSAGTDGQDGPTDAAGALSHLSQGAEAINQGLDPQEFLNNNDSYSFYSALNKGKHLLKTGLTGTNVMDLHIILVKDQQSR